MLDHPHDRVRHYFTDDRAGLDDDPRMERAVDVLREYFRSDLHYSGAGFDRIVATTPSDHFTAEDIVAVSMLSVNVPPRAALQLMSGEADDLLRAVPSGASIWTNPEVLDAGGAAWALWARVREMNGVGPVTTSKLLAAKRPDLVPVFDQHVARGLQTGTEFWSFWQQVARGAVAAGRESLKTLIGTARSRAGVPSYVSDLRVVDVVVWMIEHGAARGGSAEEAP